MLLNYRKKISFDHNWTQLLWILNPTIAWKKANLRRTTRFIMSHGRSCRLAFHWLLDWLMQLSVRLEAHRRLVEGCVKANLIGEIMVRTNLNPRLLQDWRKCKPACLQEGKWRTLCLFSCQLALVSRKLRKPWKMNCSHQHSRRPSKWYIIN